MVERGFLRARLDLKPIRKLVTHPGRKTYRIAEGIEAMPLLTAAMEITGTR